ncbi:hypothetical protein HETIRDRAFT_436223 [Heterobasidion irregulare TC 32-1]|uniref:Uncharacterized protein n=1 Tax=Heterobasidion irregulare (strain TC 32-1) TaxID=747525 RepID=W4JUU4_HETIT|nr:uncharacterized protein HETIRDRAFT_436223 [Heterobasidion irregulare TC 32-1]ETW77292.1 hypothetical protein HETIRDRAFT_436223 [Heterobasidion irregulare TC 32-1]
MRLHLNKPILLRRFDVLAPFCRMHAACPCPEQAVLAILCLVPTSAGKTRWEGRVVVEEIIKCRVCFPLYHCNHILAWLA